MNFVMNLDKTDMKDNANTSGKRQLEDDQKDEVLVIKENYVRRKIPGNVEALKRKFEADPSEENARIQNMEVRCRKD